jgi:hypothetical protein
MDVVEPCFVQMSVQMREHPDDRRGPRASTRGAEDVGVVGDPLGGHEVAGVSDRPGAEPRATPPSA